MIASMDLNAPPEPEEDEVFPQHSEEDNAQEEHIGYNRAVDHGEPALSAAQRDREERIQRIRRHRPDDRPSSGYQPSQRDDGYLSKRQRPNNKLPPGWLDCPAYGNEIGPLVPSKVPLGESFNGDIPPGKRYSFRQVIQKHKAGKIVLVIDLTNSTRYYNLNELRDGIKHVKIACKGRDSVPESEAVNKFVFEVSQFLVRRKPRNFILVHCTHGHNRTGYMIVHYLMRTTTMSVTQAIKAFAEARPPGIYKPDYIDALYIFYHEKKPDMVVCPSTPDWKRSSDLDLNGYAVPDDDDDDGDSIVPPDESHEIYLTNDDLLGDKIPNDQEIMMRQFCYQTLKLPGGIRGHQQFPGSHPVSLNRENLQLLRQRYYYATWKADGTRYMMLITMDGCYLIDRHFNFRRVQMRFPWRITTSEKGVPPEQKYHHYTLLDGEMVIDKLPDTDKQERRYLVYDMMAINHVSLVERPFVERWTMIDTEVIGPRNDERQNIYQSQNPYYRYELEPFRARRKDFWPLSTVTKILEKFIPSLSHEADGLIFQGWDDPYVPRTHEGLLKWKYPELNSVDFLFEMVESRQQLYLFKRGKKELMNNRVVFPDGPASSYSGKIIECSWNSEEGEWVCIRVRVDKGTPNEFNTYQKVMRSIRDNITGDVLLNEINEIIRLPMYADRIEKESKGHNASRRRCARRETQHVLATVTTVADMIPQQHQESAN